MTYFIYSMLNNTFKRAININLAWFFCAVSTLSPLVIADHTNNVIPPFTPSPIYLENKRWDRADIKSADAPLQQLKIKLGKKLFEDPRLSESGKMACSTCHLASMGFSDGRDFSLDNQGNPLPYNTPSVEYVAYNYYFGWIGQYPRLQDHLDALMLNPKLMNRDWVLMSQQLNKDKQYAQDFKQAGYNEISRKSISDAIIQYEYSLAKLSRYDFYLLGDKQQFSKEEQEGYGLFKDFGCGSCHQGINLGGNLRQKFGVMNPIFTEKNSIKARDYGFYIKTQQDEDRFYFRVPSLRNVSNTAPYFHNGSAKTLIQAIEVMFRNQLGIIPSNKDMQLIEAFLRTLEPSE